MKVASPVLNGGDEETCQKQCALSLPNRHRQVPGSNQRQYWQVPASVGWQPVPQRQA